MRNYMINLTVLALLAAAGSATASDAPVDGESPWRLGLAVGYGERSNPLIQSDDVPLIVDVDIAWFGKRLFFDNGDAGYTIHQGRHSTLSVVGRINSDRLFFSRTDTRFFSTVAPGAVPVDPPDPSIPPDDPSIPPSVAAVTVPDRDYAIEAGLELLTDGEWGQLQVTAHRDVSGTHDGYEISATYARGFRSNRWFFEPSFGLSFKSAKQNDYYWGVDASESGVLLPAYEAESGTNLNTRMLLSYQIDRHWAAVAVAYYEKLAEAVSNSPLVEDDFALAHYLGLQYRF